MPLLPLEVKASFPVKVNKSQQPNFHLHHGKSQFTTDASNMQNIVQILLKVHKVFQNSQHRRTQNCPLFLSLGPAHNQRKKNPCLQFLLYAQELGTFAGFNDGFHIHLLKNTRYPDTHSESRVHCYETRCPDLPHAGSCLLPLAHIIICMAIQEALSACSP